MRARQAVIREPFQTAVREVDLPEPTATQILIACEVSCVSAGTERAVVAGVARYGLGAAVRAGLTLGRSAAVLGLGIIGQFGLRCLLAAGAGPVVGIDAVPMRRKAALAAGADAALDPAAGDLKQ